MTQHALTFDAVAEAEPGPKWAARWSRSWPAYKEWFRARSGDNGPSRARCEAALAEHMPELVPVQRQLTRLAGGGDRAARFLSTWCPPPYLGGCSMASLAKEGVVRLVRNYDLSPDLNEGLLLRTEWTGMPVMGMSEFLWGLSDGVNARGLCAALAYGGRRQVGRGFGVTTIVRYVLETCGTVNEALAVLKRVPSHMAYNITLADRHGATATAELLPGGGVRVLQPAIAANHQHGTERADRPGFTRTHERHDHLKRLIMSGIAPEGLGDAFLDPPLHQRNYAQGLGTLFTAVYDPLGGGLVLRWPGHDWAQCLDAFTEGRREISYGAAEAASSTNPFPTNPCPPAFELDTILNSIRPYFSSAALRELDTWAENARRGSPDWAGFGRAMAMLG